MTNRRVLQIVLLALVLTSATMLSISIGHFYLIPIVFLAVIAAFIVTDFKEWVSSEGWIANLLSIGILLYSMYEFYPADSAGKLIAVAKLLVYLQVVLVFQQKTPRLNWQVMVLSLLQAVITTIFSVDFEGGVLFFIFFILGGIALVLQNSFSNECAIGRRNESSLASRRRIEVEESSVRKLAFWRFDSKPIPNVTSLAAMQKFALRPLAIMPGVFVLASIFTLVVFLTAPRHVDPWFSTISYKVSSTGITHEVDLEETGTVDSSSRKIFEAKFTMFDGNKSPVQLSQLPYFRGIALSNLTFKNGKTKWNAAYERVHLSTYQSLPNLRGLRVGRFVVMDVTLEKSTEPLLYTAMPMGIANNTPGKIKFCHEISAVTRCRENEEIDFAPYNYELMIPLDGKNAPGIAWPYLANVRGSKGSMSNDPAQHRWLTRMDRKNYPKLVEIADSIAEEVRSRNGGRVELVRAIENHFLDPSNYSYTQDYTDVERNTDIDPNEDFVSNFRTGHCEAFASAMTLMLRSQGIPARLVAGFHGGEYDDIEDTYVVRGSHAHAWVEVYLRRRDCRLGKLETWQYGEGGAWLTADPTPPQPEESTGLGADGAIELARSVWQDYVLGIDSDKESDEETTLATAFMDYLSTFQFDQISNRFNTSRESGLISILQPVFVVVLILAALIAMLKILIVNADYEEDQPDTAVGKIKRFFADAIGLISSDFREWVIGQDAETAFYGRLVEILEAHELVREPAQTHREFAHEVSSKFSSHPSCDMISSVLSDVTESFNRVIFGRHDLDEAERTRLGERLEELDQVLKISLAG